MLVNAPYESTWIYSIATTIHNRTPISWGLLQNLDDKSYGYGHFGSLWSHSYQRNWILIRGKQLYKCYAIDTTTPKVTFEHYSENCHSWSNILIIYGNLQHPKHRHCWYTAGSAGRKFNYSEYFDASAQDINDYDITSINNKGQYFNISMHLPT